MRTLRNCERNRRTYKIKKSEWQEVFQSEKNMTYLNFMWPRLQSKSRKIFIFLKIDFFFNHSSLLPLFYVSFVFCILSSVKILFFIFSWRSSYSKKWKKITFYADCDAFIYNLNKNDIFGHNAMHQRGPHSQIKNMQIISDRKTWSNSALQL